MLFGTFLFGAQMAYAQSFSGDVEVTIVSPLSLAKVDDLQFGNLLASSSAGTVTVSPSGIRSTTGGVTGSGGVVSSARFIATGSFLQFVRINTQTGSIPLNRIGGGGTMTLRDLQTEVGSAIKVRGNSGFYLLLGTGPTPINVGGTLDVKANQAPGSYEGSFDVTITYF